jgi:hypothetical protein
MSYFCECPALQLFGENNLSGGADSKPLSLVNAFHRQQRILRQCEDHRCYVLAMITCAHRH